MIDELHEEMKASMAKSVEALQKDLKRIRTGRASLALLDGLMVDYYGSATPINQLATLSIPEPRQIVIQPWDSQAVPDIEKALLKSELGLTPMNDGKIIRIVLPPLTAERRKELVKIVKKMGEEFKVQVRNHRRDANDMLKEMKKDKEISEDEQRKAQEQVQKTTDGFVVDIDNVVAEKEAEIMEI
ncbi:MAG: ribosome recycling factor [Desulfomonilaceae bacterium]|jgi:ribosome recycling factor|nr:ribosome recycling factor [Desulfomonilaceae bacterium]